MKTRVAVFFLLLFATIALASKMDDLELKPTKYVLGTPTAPAVSLGTPTPGTVRYCANCSLTNPCSSGGTGAIAKGEGTAWNCAAPAPTAAPGSGNFSPYNKATPLPTRSAFNCKGAVTCSDDAVNGRTDIDVPTPVPTSPAGGTPGGSSGNLQTNNGSGGFGAYAGATCPTPGFPISSDASGGWTCATPIPPTPVPTATPGAGGSSKPFMSWSAGQATLPASSYPQFGINNNHMVLVFDQSADECAYFEGILPTGYAGGGLKVRIDWNGGGATSGAAGWLTAFERMDSATSIGSDSFGTQKSASTTTTGTASATNQTSITHTSGEIDSLAAGEGFRLRLCRDGDGSVVTDSVAADAQMNHVSVEEP